MTNTSGPLPCLAPPEDLVVKEITDEAGWAKLESAWRQLYQASPNAVPPLSWDWLREWWRVYGRVYGKGGTGLRIQTVWRGSRLVAALPVYLRATPESYVTPVRLCMLSSGEDEFEETCAEYLDLLYLPGDGEASCRLLLQRLLSGSRDWDEIDFNHLAADSLLARVQTAAGHPFTVRLTRPSYTADLSGGFEAYLKRLSANTRANARRLLRQARLLGAVFECASEPAQIDEFFAQLVGLHQARWQAAGKPGNFDAPHFQEFHHSLCRRLCHAGAAVLARLSCQGQPLSVVLGYVARGELHYYVSGTRRGDSVLKSPGIVVHLLLKRHAAERGYRTYDYLPGGHSYKRHYATGERPMVRLRLTRPTLRTGLHGTATMVRRIGRRLSRWLTRRQARSP